MQRKVCVARIESVADTPWLNGKIRVARECAWAPEFISGVPLHSGQRADRRLKNPMNHIITLKKIALTITLTANWLGSINIRMNAVTTVIIPMYCSAEKNAATLNGPLDGSERARSVFAFLGSVASSDISRRKLRNPAIVCKA